MGYIDQDRVDIINYIIAFSDEEISEEIRNKALVAVKNIDDYRRIFSDMLVICKRKFFLQHFTEEEFNAYFNFIKNEYILLGFNNYIDFNYIEDILYLSIRLSISITTEPTFIWDKLCSVIDTISTCSDNILKNEVYYLCVFIINKCNAVNHNIEKTAEILEYCRDIDFDSFHIQKLPDAIFML